MAAGRVPKPLPDPGTILRVAEHFLRLQHFTHCREYVQHVSEIDPNFPGVSQIRAVVDVLLASKNPLSTEIPHDWYAVMQLDRFSHDSDLIGRRFSQLYGLLDPSNNKFPFSDKAFDLVCDAWYVLSNPEKRLEFDDSLKRLLNDEKSKDTSVIAFWTVCPYCYHVYEFPRVYLELFLMCPNEKCSKAFTCVEIDRPPAEVLTQGNYICAGFSPLGFRYCNWNPFAPLKKQETKPSPVTGKFVQISDDEEDEATKEKDVKDEAMKPPVRRIKMMAKRTKKVTGVGNRVTKEGFVHQQETNPSTHSPDNDDDDDDDCEHNFSLGNVGEVEFHDGDDDILVSLQNGI
ncbi:uncharacterized protein LOC111883369 [Lactuca sativa]|uniref:J domain-containing protein n=1 Tax=Lactuca sativa TaxID=4236 RepID=A0A9R1WF41_LACSA|nr:uncharacterized protein LOC111883369 [Lactuca sativa]KAJ0222693.1 hypothetical protein LSAT_V11C200075550 [Lactuca sativa]